jgi:formylglycine-generating enzyme required for sulfatase activity
MMGCAPSDNTCLLDQKPRHQVTISDFLVMDTLLTYAQCSSFQLFPQATCRYMDPQGTLGASINDVATALTWQQAVQVCELLGGRLPTEAEFEFMVRAGGNARFFCGEQESCLGSLVCTSGLSTCQRVRQRAANPWGLYDLNGVMAQHVQDYYSSSYYGPDPVTDPQGPATGVFRGGRGVGWIQSAACSTYCYYYTASMRYYSPPDFGPAQGGPRGVRCVRELP